MGFGTDLQGRASHDALLHLQDTEIRLLEAFKKCMTQRIYADKEYATALGNVVNTAMKLDIQQYDSPVFKVRQLLIGSSVSNASLNIVMSRLHQASASTVMTLVMQFSLKTVEPESLQNSVATHPGATPLISMRAVSLASSQH